METVSDSCPTGILIDIGLQTALNNIKENKDDQGSIKIKNEKNTVADANSSHPWTLDVLDQSSPKPTSILKANVFCTPKSNWKTPSPKSMKIISQDASRIIDQLYSSPINCSEGMIYDEVFPVVKSLDDDCFDELYNESRSRPTKDKNVHEKADQNNPNSFDLTKCTISAVSVIVPEEKLSTMVLHSDNKHVKEHDSNSKKTMDDRCSENESIQELCSESAESDKKLISVTCIVNSNPTAPECVNLLSDQFSAPEHKVTSHKKLPEVAKGFGFKKFIKHFAERNKENEFQLNGTRQAKYKLGDFKTEKSCSSIEIGKRENKTKKNQILKDEFMVEQSSAKYITKNCSILEKKKAKEGHFLGDHASKNMTVKPKALQQKSSVGRSQSLLCKRDLCKTGTLLGTPTVQSSVRRFSSFNGGSTRKAIPTVERKHIPTTETCCRILKPKMSLNQVSNIESGFSTPLQFRRCSQSFKLADSSSANPIRRKSFAFNSNHSLVAGGMKVAAQKDQHPMTKKHVTSNSRPGFSKNLNVPSSHPKFKNDSLPRKLFP